MSGREPESAEFAPERLSTGSRRRLDPLAIGAIVVVAGLGLAVVKPWGATSESAVATASAPAEVAETAPATTDAPTVPKPAVTGRQEGPIGLTAPLLSWATADAALRDHDAWGIRTLIADPDPDPAAATTEAQVVERWTEIRADRSPTKAIHLLSGDRAILAIGLTFPHDQAPLDTRLWREVEDGWEWLATDALDETDLQGSWLFAPPKVGGGYLATWPPGRYRAEWLGPSGIQQVTFRIAGRFSTGGPSLAPLKPPDRRLPSPVKPDFEVVDGDRLFAVTRGIATGLDAPGTTPFDPARAWQEAIRAADDWPEGEIAHAFLPEANGLGVLFPSDAHGAEGSIVSLGPGSPALDAQRLVGMRFADTGRTPYVIFRAPGGGTWLPGVYRLDVSWTGTSGPRRTSYHVEVRPAP